MIMLFLKLSLGAYCRVCRAPDSRAPRKKGRASGGSLSADEGRIKAIVNAMFAISFWVMRFYNDVMLRNGGSNV